MTHAHRYIRLRVRGNLLLTIDRLTRSWTLTSGAVILNYGTLHRAPAAYKDLSANLEGW